MPPRGGGGTRGNYPEARKKLKLLSSVICCNDIAEGGSFLLATPGPVLALGGPVPTSYLLSKRTKSSVFHL